MVFFFLGMCNLNAMGPELRVIEAHVIKELGKIDVVPFYHLHKIPWTA